MRPLEPRAQARRRDPTLPAVGYLAAQAVLAASWWALLVSVPAVRARFEVTDTDPTVLDAFLVADLFVFIGGSAAAAIALHRQVPSAAAICWFVAGGVVSATVLLVALAATHGGGAVGIVPMAAASIITTAIAATASPAPEAAAPVERLAGPNR